MNNASTVGREDMVLQWTTFVIVHQCHFIYVTPLCKHVDAVMLFSYVFVAGIERTCFER